jgi:hypothetical protein
MRDTQTGKNVTDARVDRAQADYAGEVFGGRARITGEKANPAAQSQGLSGVDVEG